MLFHDYAPLKYNLDNCFQQRIMRSDVARPGHCSCINTCQKFPVGKLWQHQSRVWLQFTSLLSDKTLDGINGVIRGCSDPNLSAPPMVSLTWIQDDVPGTHCYHHQHQHKPWSSEDLVTSSKNLRPKSQPNDLHISINI